VRPEHRERRIEIKGLTEKAYWDLTPPLLPDGFVTNVGKWCFPNDLGHCVFNGRIQAEHVDGMR
jgi:hypothetical protein